MRKKLIPEEKRSIIIGIKVKPEVKEKLTYLSEAEATKLSTYINNILEEHIKTVTKICKIDWNKIKSENET